jgi:hypothetical protein
MGQYALFIVEGGFCSSIHDHISSIYICQVITQSFQDPRPMTMDMLKETFAGNHQVRYEKPGHSDNQLVLIKVQYSKPNSNQALNTSEV